jgi:S-formylglutathione hydrolase
MKQVFAVTWCLASLASASAVSAQTGSVERVKVHGKLLEGNLSGDSPDRNVTVYLPPGYPSAKGKRYPVLYVLHGYTDNDEKWMGLVKHWISLPAVIDKALAGKEAGEMIVVMPDGFTRFHGSMYSNSVVTGDWEDFIAHELVAYVDGHYRTLPTAASRGLAGHSMGGYGALRIGMKHPEVFSAVYLLSPCCLAAPDPQRDAAFLPDAARVTEASQIDSAEFMPRIMLASAAAWSPNPGKPPLYLDLPWKDGQWQPDIAKKWAANAPLETIDQYVSNLKRLKGLGFDAGDQDQPIAKNIGKLDEVLKANSVPHLFTVYQGDHLNRIAERIETTVLPFFTKNLSFAAAHR